MKCVIYDNGLDTSNLRLAVVDIPELGSHEVLLRVFFAGVNRPDILQRQGKYNPPKDASKILGLEASGEIVRIGSSVTRWQVGDKVTALLHGGGYAEFAVANQYQCLRIPDKMSLLDAGALCENYFTVWENLFRRGNLTSGENVLIHGGASGIGTTAIQLASHFGANVWVTVGSDKKCDFCCALGALDAVNYNDNNFLDFFIQRGQPIRMDVILDMVGGDYIERNLDLLTEDGRLIFIAFLKGSLEKINFAKIMSKRLTLCGSTLRPQSLYAKAQIAQGLNQYVWPLLDQKIVEPIIDSVFDLNDVADAHKKMESSTHIGKIMLKVLN